MKGKRTLVGLLAAALVLAAAVSTARADKPEQESRVIVFDGRAWLGVQIRDITAEKARELKLPGDYGVLIEEVTEGSPAAEAGLQKNDVILSFAGERVRSVAQLTRLVRETPPGRAVTLEVSRNGQKQSVTATLKERERGFLPRIEIERLPEIHVGPLPDIDVGIWGGPRLGISGDDLTPQLAEYFGVKQGKGVLVREVVAGSAAEKAGLKAGDVIVRVDDEEVDSVRELRRELRDRAGKEITVGIVRDRREQSVPVKLEEARSFGPRRRAEVYWAPEQWERYGHEIRERAREMERQIREALEAKQVRQQIEQKAREAEQRMLEIEQRLESEKFQEQMRQLERQMEILKRRLAPTQVI